tara:strand:- start:88 stop:279 length:192 start_codon:yes stop_codon:yes gene_type:complete
MKKDSEHNKNKIELNSMVKVSINEQEWIGQVVEIRDGIALIQLLDNMHYHATLNELTLLRERG